MKRAKEYLIFPLDVPTADEAKRVVTQLHEYVGMFKIGLELFIRSGPALIRWIREQTGAPIFLDLKLHDIPMTVQRAMQSIIDLDVALTTVHCAESQAMLEAAVRGSNGKVGVLGVTVLTSVAPEDIRTAGYQKKMADDMNHLVLHKAAMAKAAGCAGVVCSGQEVARIKAQMGGDFIAVTPGIRLDWQDNQTDDQQRVVTPTMAIADGADYLVVGRPIRDAHDPVTAAVRIADEIESVL